MKSIKTLFAICVTISLISCHSNDRLSGVFSVSQDKKINFSKGNLQYQATTDTWRFAEQQYDYVGNMITGSVYENGEKSSNTKIDKNYNGWIDLFGWGTSGYAGKYPFMVSEDDDNYSDFLEITNTQYDWGTYNIINGDSRNKWRTMTYDEWKYLIYERINAENLRLFAVIDKTMGLILLPDNYWSKKTDIILNLNDNDIISNIFNLSQWEELEKHGAVFLPCAGQREGKEIHFPKYEGVYWTSTGKDNSCAYIFDIEGDEDIDEDSMYDYGFLYDYKSEGCSVRLITDVKNEKKDTM